MKLFTKRKAVVEVQFNWIFVIIVGGLLLLFFGSFIVKQKQTSDIKLSSQVITDLSSILTGAGVSTGAAQLIEVPDLPIRLSCDWFGIKDIEKPISKSTPVFAPSETKGNFIMTWTQEWNVPFRVANFLYVTSPQVRYIIVGSNQIASQIFENLPPKTIIYNEQPRLTMNKELVSITEFASLKDLRNYKVRFVFLDQQSLDAVNIPEGMIGIRDDAVTAVVFKDGNINFGQVDFYKKNKDKFALQGSSVYAGEATLYGAIFVEDIETYQCIMNKAFSKLYLVSGIYLDRTRQLYEKYIGNPVCSTYYEDGAFFNGIRALSANGFSSSAVALQGLMNSLKVRNQNIMRASCAALY